MIEMLMFTAVVVVGGVALAGLVLVVVAKPRGKR